MNHAKKQSWITNQIIFAFVLFLLFFPLKTQFYNLIYFLLDTLITRGEISKVFTYNYLGFLLGCLEIQELKETLGFKSEIFNSTAISFFFLLSIVSWFFLKRRVSDKHNFNYTDWILLAVFSFSLVDSLDFLLNLFNNFSAYMTDINKHFIRIIKNGFILFLAGYFFFKVCNVNMKKQILFIVFPVSIISFIVWFFYLGPMFLPIVTRLDY
ncbi:hypothetical protein [Xanthomarina spongicola]|uniref:Uncharacterized protein n=1 Tax=Xanthomarina spongicola TaxID=570520 RepID=A0A316DQ70_9FLAO|nr:hypothetical protein [Xanthomarina spongicola]PWK20377.1 hypothetical protein LX78_00076 [Xanthomarina spongicola]